MASIIIGGDTCPHTHQPGRQGPLLEGVSDRLRSADAVIVNLECPLTDTETRIEKTGPSLRAPTDIAQQLHRAGVTVCAMANNHIMDYGAEGLFSSMAACKEAGMHVVGAGSNLEEAQRPLVVDLGGFRLGVVACAEHEWSIAGRVAPGANPLDMPDLMETLSDLKARTDGIVVLIHGGREYYPLPYPKLQHWCRHLIRAGADAVLCQHSHCPGAYEEHESGFISYGQGNLVFPPVRSNVPASWFEGYLVELSFDASAGVTWEVLPCELNKDTGCPHFMGTKESGAMTTRLEGMREILTDPDRLDAEWNKVVRQDEGAFLAVLAGGNRYVRGVNRRWPILRHWYTTPKRKLLLNMIRCEAHREAYLSLLKR